MSPLVVVSRNLIHTNRRLQYWNRSQTSCRIERNRFDKFVGTYVELIPIDSRYC